MNHDFDYDNADRKDLLERCKKFEAAIDAQHSLCMATFKDSDTYRDLCAELLDQIYRSLPFVEDHEGSDLYKSGALTARIKSIKSAIAKAETILGEKNGNAN